MNATKISVSVTILVLTTLLYGCTYGGQPPAANPGTPSVSTNPPPTMTPTAAPVSIPPLGASQRLVGRSFTATGQTLTLTGPPNSNVAPPGVHLLFLVNTDGVPSVGQAVTVQ